MTPQTGGSGGGRELKDRAAAQQRGIETILVVDDEDAILSLIRLGLERDGYRVMVARSPDDAFRLWREHSGDIRLVIADVRLGAGVQNGTDLVAEILRGNPSLKAIVMTGQAAVPGAPPEPNVLRKPFELAEFSATVRRVLDEPGSA